MLLSVLGVLISDGPTVLPKELEGEISLEAREAAAKIVLEAVAQNCPNAHQVNSVSVYGDIRMPVGE